MPILYLVLALIIVAALAWVVKTSVGIPENVRPILIVVLALVVVGMALWLVNTYVPMADSIKTILNVFVVLATLVLVLQAVGLWGSVVRMWNNTITHLSHRAPIDNAHETTKPAEPLHSEPSSVSPSKTS